MLKNVLKTFEAEMLKIFRNIQPQPKSRCSFIKKKSAERLRVIE